jgi:hypothetical protein
MVRWYQRSLLLGLLLALGVSASAQTPFPEVDSRAYTAWKLSQVSPSAPSLFSWQPGASPRAAGLKSSGLIVPYPGDGGWSILARNDDGFTGLLPLGFDFTLYGSTYNRACVNNNGNISFGACYSEFTATGFPSSAFVMVAPFWADVDTRCANCGLTYYKSLTYAGRPAFVAHYEAVGYYNQRADKLNTFQVIITDQAVLPGGNNVCFGYGDMQWTTGSASGGINGFAGTPATVGANAGDGVSFFQYGRFDRPGTAYDGPGGNPDGVGHLSGQTICFNTGASAGNVPPVVSSSPSSPIGAAVGSPVAFSVTMIPPETNQTVTLSTSLPAWLSCTLTNSAPGGTATAECSGTPAAAGAYTASITGTDDGTPPLSTTVNIRIVVEGGDVVDTTAPVCGAIRVEQQDGALSAIVSSAADPESGIASVYFRTLRNVTGFAGPDAGSLLGPYAQGQTVEFDPDETPSVALRAERISFATGGTFVVTVTNGAGLSSYCDPVVSQLSATAPEAFDLEAPYPNPARAGEPVRLGFALSEASPVRLAVYDVVGREVARLVDGTMEPGRYEVAWTESDASGGSLAAGVYIVRMEAGAFARTLRVTVLP